MPSTRDHARELVHARTPQARVPAGARGTPRFGSVHARSPDPRWQWVGVVEWEGPSSITPLPAPPPGPEDLRRQRALASRVSIGASARGPGFPGAETPVTAAPACVGRAGRLDPAGMTSPQRLWSRPGREGGTREMKVTRVLRLVPAWPRAERWAPTGPERDQGPHFTDAETEARGPSSVRLACLGDMPWLSPE